MVIIGNTFYDLFYIGFLIRSCYCLYMVKCFMIYFILDYYLCIFNQELLLVIYGNIWCYDLFYIGLYYSYVYLIKGYKW